MSISIKRGSKRGAIGRSTVSPMPVQAVDSIAEVCSMSQVESSQEVKMVARLEEARVEHSPEDSGWSPNSDISGVNRIEDIGQDVLQLIFDHFDLQPGSQTTAQTRKDLLSAAKSCKAFAEPALNSLWRVLPSFLPLLLLFSSAEVVDGHYFIDNLSLVRWERFEIHARRVRTLYMETTHVTVSPNVYILIRDMYGSSLLPGLKAIYIPDDNTIDLSSVILLGLGVSLDVVELNDSAISQRDFFIPFLTLLGSTSPQLSRLVLCGLGNISLDPLYCFKSIQRLEIRLPGTFLYPKTLQRLENLVDLQDLTLHAGVSTPTRAVDARRPTHSPSESRSFEKLRRLHIIGSPNSITRVLDDINLTNLTALVIDETPDSTGSQTESFWRRCFHQVSACLAIEDIQINQVPHRPRGHEYNTLSTSWLLPLTDLNNVKSLVINGPALSGPDDDFRVMAAGFRKLKKLVVPSAYHSQGRTLACLFYFSQYCPDLSEIKICIGFDIVKNLAAIKKLPPPDHQHPLEKLYVNSQFGQVQTGHLVQVAQFLNLLFPNLSVLETYDSNSTEASTWMGIEQIRIALQAPRINPLTPSQAFKSEVATTSPKSHSFTTLPNSPYCEPCTYIPKARIR